jgi:hypothetical protein
MLLLVIFAMTIGNMSITGSAQQGGEQQVLSVEKLVHN